MSKPLVIIPARAGSRGIPDKNFKLLAGIAPVIRAYEIGRAFGRVVVSTDRATPGSGLLCGGVPDGAFLPTEAMLYRPAELATDTTPMIAVIQHVLAKIPGPPDQQIVLLQPTQPLRTAAHVKQALEALTLDWDSVVTITPIPRTHHPSAVVFYEPVTLQACPNVPWSERPARRQAVQWPYIPDGTAYVFRRRTVEQFGNIFGELARAIIIGPEDTCALDTPHDWAEAERRLRARTP